MKTRRRAVGGITTEGLLLRFPIGSGARSAFADAWGSLRVSDIDFELEPLFQVPPSGGLPPSAADPDGHEWFVARPQGAALSPSSAWEAAYRLMADSASLGAVGAAPDFVEPDLLQEWGDPRVSSEGGAALGIAGGFDDQDDHAGQVPSLPRRFAWHLDDEFTQLRAARDLASQSAAAVRIAHLDTGYDPGHRTFPKAFIDKDLQRNFVDGKTLRNDARDRGVSGILKNPGHGTGTLSILAGAKFAFSGHGYDFDATLGGAFGARIVPVRVGNSVVQIRTSSVAQGISYVADLCGDPQTRVQVISMSMGGLASAAWAAAVNRAYLQGIVFVAAAGNNFSGLPTHFIVYPARFNRVIAACGVMADGRAYYDLPRGVMQGCWGPKRKMHTAMSAFTPNVPWAEMGASDIVDMDGQGTSSATPQIAAAAALYFQAHQRALFDIDRYPEPWMRAEAVRQALFSSAATPADAERLGRGVLRALDALARDPVDAGRLSMAPKDRASFAFLRVLTGLGVSASPIDDMLQLEATQLAQRWPEGAGPNPLEAAMADPDEDVLLAAGDSASSAWRDRICRYLEALHDHPEVSPQLRRRTDQVRGELRGTGPVRPVSAPPASPEQPATAPPPSAGPSRPFEPPTPPHRSLRAYALDPSLSGEVKTMGISEMAIHVPWEQLAPGPRGEYLEVIDIDPGSGCFYEPVDLDDPRILAQQGLPPSEGTPQFHQQMVYAAAMSTISNFEHALGRKALWRPGPSPDPARPRKDSTFVQRLRIHPHALREANAYYSPERVALLFGYFGASRDKPGQHLPGGRVFTCLSHDIIAHEVTHALLDGMHRRFLLPSNPDVRAFHEAFADIVALFQHFTFPEVVKHQIASTQGDIRNRQSLFGELAIQFGRGRGMRGALREAIGAFTGAKGEWEPHRPDPNELREKLRPHERGGVLVGAVFDAFLAIYDRRVADLLRLATGGSGVLSPGALHPDLVNRLASEASKAAAHVLTMCIRALDYCPPTDITFSDYLRAILTADYDVLKDDALGYRVAFVEAFRRRGIYPPDLRTLAVESLLWREPGHDDPPRPDLIRGVLQKLGRFATRQLYARDRREIFKLQYVMRASLHRWLDAHFLSGDAGREDARFLGLETPAEGRMRFEVHTARIAHRASPDGSVEPRLILALLQERRVPANPLGGTGTIAFEGGCTIVAELRTPRVLYSIRKRIGSQARLRQQQEFAAASENLLRSTYLGPGPLGGGAGRHDDEPFALMHRGG
jgi:subtilisin family serine protease